MHLIGTTAAWITWASLILTVLHAHRQEHR